MAISFRRALLSYRHISFALRTSSLQFHHYLSYLISTSPYNTHRSAKVSSFLTGPATNFLLFESRRGFARGRKQSIKEQDEDEEELEDDHGDAEEDANLKAVAGLRRINLEGLKWRVFDAKGQVLGRLASQISTVVQGKDKPTYTPNHDEGDMCIVINAKDVCITGRKLTDKFYRWHTGYIGHLKERSLKDQMVKDPTEVIRKAVMRMLPRNKLRDDRDRKLRIFAGSEHPFGDRPLEPYEMPPRQVREMRPRARRAMIRAQKKAEQQEEGVSTYTRKDKRKEEVDAEVGELE